MKEDSFWIIIKADIKRYTGSGRFSVWQVIRSIYHEPGLIYVIFLRFSQKVRKLNNSFLRLLFNLIFVWTIFKILGLFLGIQIHLRAKIGKGFYIGHYGEIFIGAIEMGKYCNVSQQVSIGHGGRGTDRHGVPKIGEYVYIGPGAKLFGKIRIGNNVSIGANAVVSKDIPDNAIVVGNPGRIVGYQEKNEYIHNADE